MKSEIIDILLSSSSSSSALNNIYLLKKLKNNIFSLAYICSKSQIKSKGYLGDVLKGKRTLNRKYNFSILNAFSLDGVERKILYYLLQIDQEECEQNKKELNYQLEIVKKSLLTSYIHPPLEGHTYLMCILLASFGVLKDGASLNNFCSMHKDVSPIEIRSTLEKLVSMELIRLEGENYYSLEKNIVFKEGDMRHQSRYIKSGLDFVRKRVDRKIGLTTDSYFESSVLSIQRSRAQEFFKDFRQKINEELVHFESDDGDCLVHFHIQSFTS